MQLEPLKFVTYDGDGSGYLVILTAKDPNPKTDVDDVIFSRYARKGERIVVPPSIFELLKAQGHLVDGKLREV